MTKIFAILRLLGIIFTSSLAPTKKKTEIGIEIVKIIKSMMDIHFNSEGKLINKSCYPDIVNCVQYYNWMVMINMLS